MLRVLVLSFTITALAFAQTDTATLSGTVYDAAAAAVPNAVLTVRGCKPKPPKIPSRQIEPRYDRI